MLHATQRVGRYLRWHCKAQEAHEAGFWRGLSLCVCMGGVQWTCGVWRKGRIMIWIVETETAHSQQVRKQRDTEQDRSLHTTFFAAARQERDRVGIVNTRCSTTDHHYASIGKTNIFASRSPLNLCAVCLSVMI